MTPRRLMEPARLAGSSLLRTQSDERLVDLTRDGNDRAFEAIVQRYRRPLLRYCTRMLPAARAEDAVQQAFLSAYSAIRAGDAELSLKPWLYRIAHNATLNALRQNGWTHEQLDEAHDGVELPEHAAERRERLGEVIVAVQALPERQRDAIVLRELEGRSYEEIAATLGVSDGAVRQLLNRARTTLRAAAAALVPPDLAARLASRDNQTESIGVRIAELCAGAGGAAAVTKIGTAVVVAGAVAGGAVQAPVGSVLPDAGKPRATPLVAEASASTSGARPNRPAAPGSRSGALVGDDGDQRRRPLRDRKSAGSGDDEEREGRSRDDEEREDEGEGDDDPREDRSGSGGGDDSDVDRSGPGDGSLEDDSRSDNSGPGGGGGSDDPVPLPVADIGDDRASSNSGPGDSSGSGSSGSGGDSGSSSGKGSGSDRD